jgi:hypothetical protein
MSQFLQLIESLNAEAASVKALFGASADGVAMREVRGRSGPQYKQRLVEAATFIADVLDGKRPLWQLREAMSTSDFPLLFGDTLERIVISEYRAAP